MTAAHDRKLSKLVSLIKREAPHATDFIQQVLDIVNYEGCVHCGGSGVAWIDLDSTNPYPDCLECNGTGEIIPR